MTISNSRYERNLNLIHHKLCRLKDGEAPTQLRPPPNSLSISSLFHLRIGTDPISEMLCHMYLCLNSSMVTVTYFPGILPNSRLCNRITRNFFLPLDILVPTPASADFQMHALIFGVEINI